MAIVPVCIQVPGDLPSLQVIRTMFLRQDLHLCIICIVACPTSLQGPVRVEVYKLTPWVPQVILADIIQWVEGKLHLIHWTSTKVLHFNLGISQLHNLNSIFETSPLFTFGLHGYLPSHNANIGQSGSIQVISMSSQVRLTGVTKCA
jgi:hypothetical protein